MAYIEFTSGIPEIPTSVRLFRSKRSERSSAVFRFETLNTDRPDVVGMMMVDEEGELVCREVRAKFVNGQFAGLEVVYEMLSEPEWNRFMRFMERFSSTHEMGLNG